jgi:hypothetical protein
MDVVVTSVQCREALTTGGVLYQAIYRIRLAAENKPLLNQVNYALLHLHLAGKHDAKPSHEELKDWLNSGQVDVIRVNK